MQVPIDQIMFPGSKPRTDRLTEQELHEALKVIRERKKLKSIRFPYF
jgi:hypothetical protein